MQKQLNKQLDAIAKLEQNWDGDDADKPTSESIKRAREFVGHLNCTIKPYINPMRSGGVQFEWELGTDGYFEVEFLDDEPPQMLWEPDPMSAKWIAALVGVMCKKESEKPIENDNP